MKTHIRVAIIGCGAIAGVHLDALQAAGQEVSYLYDIDPARAKAFADRHGLNLPIYTDYTKLLQERHPDVVHICTPHCHHAEMVLSALQENIHVLCEKPLCITLDELQQITAAAKCSRATLGVCHQNRYEPHFLALREKLQQDGVCAGLGMVAWKRDESYYASGAWRGKWQTEGGGVMINQALHTLDLLQWICGMPAYVTSDIRNDHLKGTIGVEDTATALFELPDGTPLNFYATTACGGDFPAQLQLITAKGETLYADARLLVSHGNAVTHRPQTDLQGKRVWGAGHRDLIADYYRCLSDSEHFPIDAEQAGAVIRLILSMYHSHGHRIAVER